MNSAIASQPVQQILSREAIALPLLTRSDIADLPISPRDVIEAVRGAYLRVAQGSSRAPAKIMMRSPHRDSASYAMPGYDGGLQILAFKDYYMQNDEGKKNTSPLCCTTIRPVCLLRLWTAPELPRCEPRPVLR